MYTLASNQPLFACYIEPFESRSGVTISFTHHVNEQLLTDARSISNKENESQVTQQVHQAMEYIIENNSPDTIICTCSTIGYMAESFSRSAQEGAKLPKILRVDRPMADVAVGYPQIHVLAALKSTIQPTTDLLGECAEAKNLHPIIQTTVVPKAWSHLQNGDPPGYAKVVAAYIIQQYANGESESPATNDVAIVLAQASMSPAVDLLSVDQLAKCPRILSSPATCMEYLAKQIDE